MASMVDDTTAPVEPRLRTVGPRRRILLGLYGPVLGMIFDVSAATVIGREPDVGLRFGYEGVSRRHAEIRDGPDGRASIRDLGSTNGTLVNGVRVAEVVLASGDAVVIGSVELEYRLVSEAELRALRDAARAYAALAQLSERELEVARLVGLGLRNADVGKQLFISPHTVNTHMERIYGRLEIKKRSTLVRMVAEAALFTRE